MIRAPAAFPATTAFFLWLVVCTQPSRADVPLDCPGMLSSDDVFELAQPATQADIRFLEPYIGVFHSDRRRFDDRDVEYYFELRYEWFDEARTSIRYSVTMVVPEENRRSLNSEGYYAFDPFEGRLYAVGAFKRAGVSIAIMDAFDVATGARSLLGRTLDADGQPVLISDQFEWLDDDTLLNRAYSCTTDTGEWAQVYEGVFTRHDVE